MVTILSSTLDGDDVIDALERLGDASFLFAAPDLAVGEYKVKIDAEDSAGNDMESEMTLKITERKPFSLNIRAGVSLISFPGDPADPDINAVFPMDHPVQEIATYDPTMPGKWFASQRDEKHRNVGRQPADDLRQPGLPGPLRVLQVSQRGGRQAIGARAGDPAADRSGQGLEPWSRCLDVTYGLWGRRRHRLHDLLR